MAYNQEPSGETSIIKFNNQDFTTLWNHCLSMGQKFEDETFPATNSSIGQKLLQSKPISRVLWKRPQDLPGGVPHFVLDGVSRFDIQQGEAGDCWFLAALGSLTQNPQYMRKILIDERQSFSHQYAGIFRFRFWQCGQWVEVVIDDRLPVQGDQCLFVRPLRHNQEFWPCLLEKAYAKLLGSYSDLHYGYLEDGLVDLTGGVITNVHLYSSPADLVIAVKTAIKAGSLITCATPKGLTDTAEGMNNGLVSLHAYTVTGAEQIQYRRGLEEIISLWNPWGWDRDEWKGRWSDGSQEWEETCDARKSQLHKNQRDGEFWMSCQDFQQKFSTMCVCSQIPITLDRGNKLHEGWSQIMFRKRVILGSTAGVPEVAQYNFSVQEPMEGTNVVVCITVAVTPPNLKAEDKKSPLSFQVIEAGSQVQWFQEKFPLMSFFPFGNSVQVRDSNEKFHRNFTRTYQLIPGNYVVAVQTQRKSVEFLLRIFLKTPNSGRHLSSHFNRSLKGSPSEHGSQESISYRFTQQRPDIDATQLHSLLNQEFLIGPPEDTFSLDECRSLVALMELKVDGRLDQQEFARLRKRLVHYQHVFQKVQTSPGVLLSSNLGKAIENTEFLRGIFVSRDLLHLVTLRYSDSCGRVSFPSLVCFLMRLETMAKTFRNLSKDGKGLYLTEMEWMNLVMYN
uniref:Calpain-13 n=1 Tax=Aotus nancymaae TaxID=37293 RepID=A0A2K5DMH5_AOTNA|nr:calpain-13 [Aotus nancymaae]XP_012330968.1 calpain-13 [Aotus nancymaae]XP_021530108.1 calpain-13 [Aotus nancymaae]